MLLNTAIKQLLHARTTTRLLTLSRTLSSSSSSSSSDNNSDKTTSGDNTDDPQKSSRLYVDADNDKTLSESKSSDIFTNRFEISYDSDKSSIDIEDSEESKNIITDRDIRTESDNSVQSVQSVQSETLNSEVAVLETLYSVKKPTKTFLESLRKFKEVSKKQGSCINPDHANELLHVGDMLDDKDFFGVKNLFTLRELFDNRVHLGHSIGCWNKLNAKYLLGTRNNQHVIDLASTEQHLWRALNVVSHTVYNGGFVLFVNNREQFRFITKYTADKCGEFHFTKPEWATQPDVTFQHRHMEWFDEKIEKYRPSLLICTSVNHPVTQDVLLYCNKNMIPTIGLLDSDVDPTHLTYVIPGNDDSNDSMVLYHRIFCNAISRAKRFRQAVLLSTSEKSKKKQDNAGTSNNVLTNILDGQIG